MRRFIKQILLVVLLAIGARQAFSFSLLGPFETWQTGAIGYNPLGNTDIGAPKNLGEEYRWNLPVITYGFDNSFLNYFGSNGVAAIDAAFSILNSLPPFSSLSADLREYPLVDATGTTTTFRDARRTNFRAEADNLLDLKSDALGLVVEELGLADPERWVWALRDRKVLGNPPITNYLVIQRNFDTATFEPSKYVNGTRYTYSVLEFAAPAAYADAV